MLERATTGVPELQWQQADWRNGSRIVRWTSSTRTPPCTGWMTIPFCPPADDRPEPGGWLAVQMPRNHDRPPTWPLTRRWKRALVGTAEPAVAPAARGRARGLPSVAFACGEPPGHLADRLSAPCLEGPDPVAAWTHGSLLVPLLEALREEERSPSWRPTGAAFAGPIRRMKRGARLLVQTALPGGAGEVKAVSPLRLPRSSPRHPPPGVSRGRGSFRWTRRPDPGSGNAPSRRVCRGFPSQEVGVRQTGQGRRTMSVSISLVAIASIMKKI